MLHTPQKHKQLKQKIHEGRSYIQDGLWHAATVRGVKGWIRYQLQLFLLTVEGLTREKVFLKAYALTFVSLLALIPTIAVLGIILGGIGGVDFLEQTIKPMLLDHLLPSHNIDISKHINSMIGKVNIRTIGIFGLLGTIYTVLSALKSTDDYINDIMNIHAKTPLLRRFSIYWSLLTLGPLLLFGSFRLKQSLNDLSTVKWLAHTPLLPIASQLLPMVLVVLAFWMLYQFIPRKRVRFRVALTAGIATGLTWELARRIYFSFIAGSFQTNSIYGTLTVLPLTLLWLYCTWILVLAGAVFAHSIQHHKALVCTKYQSKLSRKSIAIIYIQLFCLIALRFENGAPPQTLKDLAETLNISPDLADQQLQELKHNGFVYEVSVKTGGFLPTKSLDHITLQELHHSYFEKGAEQVFSPRTEELYLCEHIRKIFAQQDLQAHAGKKASDIREIFRELKQETTEFST